MKISEIINALEQEIGADSEHIRFGGTFRCPHVVEALQDLKLKGFEDVELSWLYSQAPVLKCAALVGCTLWAGSAVPILPILESALQQVRYYRLAMIACHDKTGVPPEVIESWGRTYNYYQQIAAMSFCRSNYIPLDIIKRWITDEDPIVKELACVASHGRDDVPLEMLEELFYDRTPNGGSPLYTAAALDACRQGRYIPAEYLERWAKSDNWWVRQVAMDALSNPNMPLDVELIQRGLYDRVSYVCRSAARVCQTRCREIPANYIKRWAADDNWEIRAATQPGVSLP